MDSAEFSEWIAYSRVELFGEEREDYRAAILPYIVSSALTKKGKPPKFEDFLLSEILNPQMKRKMTHEQMKAKLKLVAAKHGKIKKHGNDC